MSALGQRLVTLADVAKSKDKKVGKVAEVLVKHNPMLNDIPYMPMNGGVIHTEEIRSGLPTVYYRKANQAIPASKTTTEERTFSAAHFESKSQIDHKVASRGGLDRIAYNRWNQAQGHLQAHAQEQAALVLYGSPEDSPLKTPGLFDVYAGLTGDETSSQVIDAGGSGSDNSSIVLVCWGENSIFGVYPDGTKAGLTRIDRSPNNTQIQIAANDVNGNAGSFYGYEEQFDTDHGLVVKDFRQGARVANIDISALQAGSGVDLIEAMIQAMYKIDSLENGSPVFYMNRTIEAFLDLQAKASVAAGGGLTYMNYQGQRVLSFRGIPIRRSDALLNTEAALT